MRSVRVDEGLRITEMSGDHAGQRGSVEGQVRLRDVGRSLLAPFSGPERDLLRVALGLHHVDRLIARPSRRCGGRDLGGWRRSIHVELRVESPRTWRSVARELASWLRFLTDDTWHLEFEQSAECPVIQEPLPWPAPGADAAVALWSGGLDSTVGGMLVARERPLVLVSSGAHPTMRRLQRGLSSRIGGAEHVTLQHDLAGSRKPERTQRTRGLLYLAIGACAASSLGLRDVMVLEPGPGAVNLPIAPSQIGAQATRACHPASLLRAERILSKVLQREVKCELPFLPLTKGQVLSRVDRDVLVWSAAHTMTCDSGPRRRKEGEAHHLEHCGLCSSCLFRRAALHAALRASDPTVYRDVETPTHHLTPLRWLRHHAGRVLEAATEFPEACHLDPELWWGKQYLRARGVPGDEAARQLGMMLQGHAQELLAWLSAHGADLLRRLDTAPNDRRTA